MLSVLSLRHLNFITYSAVKGNFVSKQRFNLQFLDVAIL